MESHGSGLRRVLLLSFCVAGIWAAYIYQGVLQETLSTKRFGEDEKRFEHLAFLNLAQNVVCLVWSFIMIKLWSNGGSGGAPWWTYWSAGITNTIGPAMGIEALKYISYPAQVLAKSSKMIPVMLMGSLVYGIRYTLPEYLCTFLVAGGVSMFALLKTSSKTISKLANPNAPLGYGLCFLNLAFDGFTNATQDSITARYPKTSAWDIMLGMNLWGTIYNMVYMFGLPHGSGFEAVQFCKQHPEAAWDILMYCLCGAVGQNFIFLTISRFGSLANTTITTTRKFVSIVVSSVLSGNPLSSKQWGCVSMVFGGLSYQIYLKWRKLQRTQKKKPETRRRRFFSHSRKMKTILSSETMDIPEGVVIKVHAKVIEVEGPRGKLTRDFKHLNLDFQLIKDAVTGKRQLKIDSWFGSRKASASIRTALSHVSNLIAGVTQGFLYKMRFVYAHFPINASISGNNKSIEIRNFLGEKKVRKVDMLDGVTIVRSEKVKDEITLEGNDIELVSRSCALINQKCHVKKKDIRKFLDGIYVSEKGKIAVEE